MWLTNMIEERLRAHRLARPQLSGTCMIVSKHASIIVPSARCRYDRLQLKGSALAQNVAHIVVLKVPNFTGDGARDGI